MSEMSEPNGQNSRDLVKQEEEIASHDLQVEESMCTEWTDEKHSLYLNSMEASFVKQLYSREYHSIDFPDRSSKRKNPLNPNLIQHSSATSRISTGQFKVFRSGYWEKLNFERAQPRDIAEESHVLSGNPWIQHFKSAGKCQEVTLPMPEENGSYCTKAIHLGQKATSSMEFPSDGCHSSHLHRQDSVSNNKEVSDQNFVDEDHEGGNFSNLYKTKRMKKVVVDVSTKDQVVPVGKSLTIADPNGTHVSPMKDGSCTYQQSEMMDGFTCLESGQPSLLNREPKKGD